MGTLQKAERLEERIAKLVSEQISIVTYDPVWPAMFEQEKRHLLDCLPPGLIKRIEHFGSTAIPGLAAKPIIDMLVEVTSLAETRSRIVPILVGQGYDYLWRPTRGEDGPPFYAWFIKRDSVGDRTHHLHMVEGHFEHWERLLFRDYLVEYPDIAREYGALKSRLARDHSNDRVAYTEGKCEFVARVTRAAKEYYD